MVCGVLLRIPSPPEKPVPLLLQGQTLLTFWRLTGERMREEKSSEGLAAGLYLRVTKRTRNCSKGIKYPFETEIISVSWV